ncbi:hypothetical protein CA51_15570 [Rosistilla oblonga]|uniref:hypothetical protein n=1 Tax=Rosistilla oblonga TaxID=2527990 RepID=UPI00118952A4|nr:hypothetical protein [Rosistilla oblonga]QDV11684.1 hypothetical protein CA51_15570 [Rosistilla oblonga]
MSEKKPTPWRVQESGKVCPICGKRTYSNGGIHPQCAVLQADSARTEKLRAERKRKASEASSNPKAKPHSTSWTQKKCPKCGKESHVRRKNCDCGHAFE